MALSKAQLKAKATTGERRFQIVPLPSGGDVRIQSLTRAEQRKCRKACQKKNGETDPAKQVFYDDILIALSAVEDSGAAIFTIQDALAGCFDNFELADTNALLKAVVSLNGMNDETGARDVDDAGKNSDETPEKGISGDSAESTG